MVQRFMQLSREGKTCLATRPIGGVKLELERGKIESSRKRREVIHANNGLVSSTAADILTSHFSVINFSSIPPLPVRNSLNFILMLFGSV